MSIDKVAVTRRERRMALLLGLPWGWRVRVAGDRLVATGERALPCGHRSVSTTVRDGDVPMAVARLSHSVRFHVNEGPQP